MPIPIESFTVTTSRLFPADVKAANYFHNHLELIVAMVEGWQPQHAGGVAAGYTYWGQFLAHELAPRHFHGPVRSSLLDLDGVYGAGWGDPRLPLCETSGKVKLALTDSKDSDRRPLCRDLIRRGNRIVAPEPRNDENLVLAQFHVLLLRLHNGLIDFIGSEYDRTHNAKEVFAIARCIVTKVFQYLTINDYLRSICNDRIYRHIFVESNRYFYFPKNQPIPLEAVSGFLRFGHTQVREAYTINSEQTNLKLREMFTLTGMGGLNEHQQLPTDKVIDWRFFFNLGSGFQAANVIEPHVVAMMVERIDIVRKNIAAGISAHLPSGQNLAKLLLERFPELSELGVNGRLYLNADQRQRLFDAGISIETPLWIFVTLEALTAPTGSKGVKLGPLGSLLMAETIRNCVQNAEIKNAHEIVDAVIERLNIKKMSDLITAVAHFEQSYTK